MTVESPQSFSNGVTTGGHRPRYAQLIYTSFDDGSGSRGGWGVKDESGDLTPEERQELTARIVTRFDVGKPLPTYPTPSQIDRRPCRLAYAPLDGEAAGYWHTVDSGRDGTGRPGNVFAHVVLDRQISAESTLRPIQLWGSPHWLRPYNAAEVAAATLTREAIPEPNGDITAESVIAFLADATVDRQSLFRVLLDAVYAAMAGGPGVMLLTGDFDSGPRWLAAISYFMSPGTARRFSWSTHDDPTLAAADLGRGIHLVVVDRERTAKMPAGQWITIDEDDEPSIGELGSTHGIDSGEVPVGGWSVLAEGVLADEFAAERLLVQQDTIAAEVGDYDLTPMWPLAVAVRQDEELSEFHADAERIIVDDAPSHANTAGWIGAALASAVVATAPANVTEAHDRFRRAHERGAGVAVAGRSLLRMALSEPEWIRNGPLADVPVDPVVNLEPFAAEIAHVLDGLATTHGADSLQLLRAQLRLAELLNRLGCDDAQLARQIANIGALLDTEALAALADRLTARPLLEDAAISVTTREKVLRPAVARLPAQVLDNFDLAVWQWLFNERAAAPVGPPSPQPHDAVLWPRYIARVLEQPQSRSLTTESAAQLAHDAIHLALTTEDLADDDCQDLVTKLNSRSHLTTSELVAIFSRWPQRIRPAAAIAALHFDPLGGELITLVADIALPPTAHRWDQCAVATARLRALCRTPRPWPAESVEQALRESTPTVLDNLPPGHVVELADDLVAVLAVLFTVGQSRGETWCDIEHPVVRELRQVLFNRAGDVAGPLADLVQTKVADVEWFVAKAVLGRISEDLLARTLFSGFPGSAGTTHEGGAVADLVVSELIRRGAYQPPISPPAVRDAVWPVVSRLSAADAEMFFAGYVGAARHWLAANGIGSGGREKHRPGFRWMG